MDARKGEGMQRRGHKEPGLGGMEQVHLESKHLRPGASTA